MATTEFSLTLDDFPLEMRIISRHAAKSGLTVSVERVYSHEYSEARDCIIFRGTQAAFAATGLLSNGMLSIFPNVKMRRLWLHGVVGYLFPESADHYRFVLEWINRDSLGTRKNMERIAPEATHFSTFKAKVLLPVEGLSPNDSL